MMRIATLLVIGVSALAVGQSPKAPKASAMSASGSYIGVMLQEIDSERAKALKLREEAGVEITHVEQDSPAEKAGLKAGDVVMQYNAQRVEGIDQFSRMIRETPGGREVKLDIVRNSTPQTVMVKVGTRRAPRAFGTGGGIVMTAPLDLHIPDLPRSLMSWRSSALGVEAESLEGQLAQYFGVKEGVLVRSVNKGSAAEKAGLKAGDVITHVDDGKVATPADISSRIRPLRGKTVPVVLMREHKEMTVSVAIDAEDRSEWFFQQNPIVPGRQQ